MIKKVFEYLISNNETISFAESCSGGNLSSSISKIPGASKIFVGSIVSYSKYSKEKVLGIKRNELKISLATVYNTLNHFADNGLIKTLQVDNQKTFFDTNTDHHYHYKYKENLQDISISDLEIRYNPKSVPKGKKVASIDVVINLRDE